MADRRPARRPGLVRTHLAGAALALTLVPLAAACSGNGGEALPSRTAAPSRTLSVTGPSQALPSASEDSGEALPSDSPPASDESTLEPTSEQSESESEAAPSVAVSRERSASVTVQQSSEVVVSATAAASPAEDPSESEGSSAWPLWALLGLVVLGVVIALWQHRQSRRREARESFDLALSESRWLGRELLPSLLAASREERRGAWSVARPRAVALEKRLAELASPGSETVAAMNAQQLETAVIGVRGALDDETRPGADAAETLGGVKQAARQLDQVLAELMAARAPE
jgi:hypothetical protein